MKNRMVIIGITDFAIAAVILLGFKIYMINQKYPNPKIITYNQEEEIKGGDITVTIQKSQLLSYEQLKEIAPEYQNNVTNTDGTSLDKSQTKTLLLELKIVNTSDEEQTMSVANFIAQSSAWSNGWDYDLFLQMNNGESPNVNLLPYEEKVIKIGYNMYDFQFKDNDWKFVNEREFYIIVSVYPVKNMIKLSL